MDEGLQRETGSLGKFGEVRDTRFGFGRLQLELRLDPKASCLNRSLQDGAFLLIAHLHMDARPGHLYVQHVPEPGDLG